MKLVLVVALCVAVSALEHESLNNVLRASPVHTMRLSELQLKVQKQGGKVQGMDQVRSLCDSQLRDILLEVEELDSAHVQFDRKCKANHAAHSANIIAFTKIIGATNAKATTKYGKWNALRPSLPPLRRKREKAMAVVKKLLARERRGRERRARNKKTYDTNMKDFAQALKDIDEIKKIIGGSALGKKQTSGNIARQGFLEVVDRAKSDTIRQMTHRFSVAASFLGDADTVDGPSGIDKVMNLILKIRNEMWAEMDKLTKFEAAQVQRFKKWLLKVYSLIGALRLKRARAYIKMGQILSEIGRIMVQEASLNVYSAKTTKKLDLSVIEKKFNHEACEEERPRYEKMRSNKLAEIQTLKKMLKILSNLGLSAPVFNAISRISVAGVDENPEPGYQLTHRMNVHTGLSQLRYDMSQSVKDFGRVAIKLQIGTSWVWASFDARTSIFQQYLIPDAKQNPSVEQSYVTNLVVKKSPSANVITGDKPSAKGNLEIWSDATKSKNFKKIEGADDGLFDFGDERYMTRDVKATDGCFQIHDFLNKQTVLAVNGFKAKGKHDVGIGNQKAEKNNQPDWTHSQNSGTLKKSGQAVIISWYIQPKTVKKVKKVEKSSKDEKKSTGKDEKKSTGKDEKPSSGKDEKSSGKDEKN